MNAHGGEIWVESQESLGSAFTFLLPMYQPQQEPSSPRSNAGQRESFETTVLGREGEPLPRLTLTDGLDALHSTCWNAAVAETAEGGLQSDSVASSSAGVRSILGPLSRSARSHRSIHEWSSAHGRGSGMLVPGELVFPLNAVSCLTTQFLRRCRNSRNTCDICAHTCGISLS